MKLFGCLLSKKKKKTSWLPYMHVRIYFLNVFFSLVVFLSSMCLMAGCGCDWDNLLATSMGHREERACFHSNVHSIGTYNHGDLLCIDMERSPSLGKVHIHTK